MMIMTAITEHEEKYLELVEKDGTWKTDVERHALLYILASDMLYSMSLRLYNFEERWIEPDELDSSYLNSSAITMAKLAFNLYNGSEAADPLTTFRNLDPENFRICIEAIQIRFYGVEYIKTTDVPNLPKKEKKHSDELER